jgi:DNA-binding FadR family transcriptional regulator
MTTAARIQHELTVAVLRGAYPAGSRLPTVRALAREFHVNPATIQRAVARLETTGLVSARQGSGITVHDPHEVGDVALVPAWLDALATQPDRAVAVLDDFLEVRRVLAARLLVRHRGAVLDALPRLVETGARLLTATTLADRVTADLGFARALLRITGNTVAISILNTAARVLERNPMVAEAMYAEPALNAASITKMLVVLASELPAHAIEANVEATIAEVDRATVERYGALLRRSL